MLHGCIPQLHAELNRALGRVPAARAVEIALLFAETRDELAQLARERMASLEAFHVLQLEQRQAFDQGLANVIAKVGLDIEVMLDGLGEDYASIPDTARDAYASTADKRERAHLQIAYSRAYIEVDGFLVRYGVIGLSLLHLRRWASRFPLVFLFPASRGRLSSCWEALQGSVSAVSKSS
jgi:hypothetical protein